MIPRISPYNDSQVKVDFPYDKEAVRQIKADIPGPGRRWDKEKKCWIVENDFADYAKEILVNVFGAVVDIDPVVQERIDAMKRHEEGGQTC